MYVQVYKPISYVSLARWNEYKCFIFHVTALYITYSGIRKMFVKYTLIQFRFRMAKLYLCHFSTLINEEILRNIDQSIPAQQQLVGRYFYYHA